jgi:hypothetical protein
MGREEHILKRNEYELTEAERYRMFPGQVIYENTRKKRKEGYP